MIIIALLEIISASMIFILRGIMHVGVALSVLFFFNSLMFLAANQPLLAIIQLFVMIGGIATYLMIGVASIPLSKFKHARLPYIFMFAVAIFVVVMYPMLSGMSFSNVVQTQLTAATLESEQGGSIGIFYILTLLLFSTGLASIVLFKRIRGNR